MLVQYLSVAVSINIIILIRTRVLRTSRRSLGLELGM